MTVAAAAYLAFYAACGCVPDEEIVLPDDAAAQTCGDAGPPEFACCSDAGRGGPVCRDGSWTCREGETTC